MNTPDITKKKNTAPTSARITCTAASRLNLTIPSIENAAAPTDSAASANVQVSSTPSPATLKASTGSAVVKVTIDSVTVKVPTESATVQASVSTPLANITASSKKRKNAEKVKVTTETLPSTTTPAKKHKRAEKTKMKTKALDHPQLCLLPSPQAMRTLSRRQKKDMGFDSEQGDGSGDEIDRDAKKDELEDNENKENEDQPNNNDENKDEARQEGQREQGLFSQTRHWSRLCSRRSSESAHGGRCIGCAASRVCGMAPEPMLPKESALPYHLRKDASWITSPQKGFASRCTHGCAPGAQRSVCESA